MIALGALVAWAGPGPDTRIVERGAVEASAAVAALRDDEVDGTRAELGAELALSAAPIRGMVVATRWMGGSASEVCPTCSRPGDLQLSVRMNALQTEHFSGGAWVTGVASWASGGVTGQALFGLSARAGAGRVWFDVSAPLLDTLDYQEALRVWPEVGVEAEWSAAHRTRVAVVGLTPSGRLIHRWTPSRTFVEGEIRLFGTAPAPAAAAVVRVGRAL